MVKKASILEVEEIANLAMCLWKGHSFEDLKNEFKDIITNNNGVVFIKYVDQMAVGFAQCQLRVDYVEGTESSPVGYLEGIFVLKDYRLNGFAKELVKQCEIWAKGNGCVEFASDCEIDNVTSLNFHKAIGFKEKNRIICFAKNI